MEGSLDDRRYTEDQLIEKFCGSVGRAALLKGQKSIRQISVLFSETVYVPGVKGVQIISSPA